MSLSTLTLVNDISRQHEGGLVYVKDWLSHHENARLIIIDTLQRFRKPLNGQNGLYGEDYDTVAAIKEVADAHGVAVLLVHHTRKAKDIDWLAEISGTTGISGAADTLMLLKRERNKLDGTLLVTGRDVDEAKYKLSLGEVGGWVLTESPPVSGRSEISSKILGHLRECGGKPPKELADALNLNQSTVRNTLARLLKTEAVIKHNGIYHAKEA